MEHHNEQPEDSSRVPEGAERFKDERKDAFLNLDDRDDVWKVVSESTGKAWSRMDRNIQEQMAKDYARGIIDEISTLSGGLWGQLSTEEKRKMFHLRLIERTLPAEEWEEAAKGNVPKPEEFPHLGKWILDNRAQLAPGTTDTEAEVLWKIAKGKWEVATAKAKFEKTKKK